MKKILFLMVFVLVGTGAFAASSLVSGTNQNKHVSLHFGRAGSLKMSSSSGDKTSKFGNIGVARNALNLPGALTVFNRARSSSGVDESDKINLDGLDGYPVALGVKDNYMLYGWLVDTKNKMITTPKEIFDFNALFDEEPQETTLTIQCNTATRLFEYELNGGGWESMPGAFCVVDDTNGKDGRTPMVQCNTKTGLFEYKYADNERWVSMDSKCIADDGVAGLIPTFKCVTPGVMVYTYNQDPEFIASDNVSVWYHPGWNILYGSKCIAYEPYITSAGLDVRCDTNKNGVYVFFINDKETKIACQKEIKDEFSGGCYGDDKLLIEKDGQKYETDFPCGFCKESDEPSYKIYCDADNFVAYKECGKKHVTTNISCGAFPLYYCNWKKGTFFLNGNIDTKISCKSVKLSCSVDENGQGIYVIDGYDKFNIIDKNGCEKWEFLCVNKNGERELVSPDGDYVGALCPDGGEYKCHDVKGDKKGYVCNKSLNGVTYIYDTYSDKEECETKCK